MNFNYTIISKNILKGLSPRARNILEKRFGLDLEDAGLKKATLESIGREYGITRERVRQIEKEELEKVKKEAQSKQGDVFRYLEKKIRDSGSLREEKSLVSEIEVSSKMSGFSGKNIANHIIFLLSLDPRLKRQKESDLFYTFWMLEQKSLERAKKVIADFSKLLKKEKSPLTLDYYLEKRKVSDVPVKAVPHYLKISKVILKNSEGEYGFSDWPEINPRGVKDMAYLSLRKEGKPLHFSAIAQNIGKESHIQTVHNELIKDARFILVGRGVYGLKEWGYEPGTVQEIIFKTLKKKNHPMSKLEIVNNVLNQRFVKKNTILLNLNNKKYFQKDNQGKYRIRLT